jgi:hypothetical protein
MSTKKKPSQADRRKARINRERAALRLRPWEVGPSEIGLREPCPYSPSCAPYDSWMRALQMQHELLASDPDYFRKLSATHYRRIAKCYRQSCAPCNPDVRLAKATQRSPERRKASIATLSVLSHKKRAQVRYLDCQSMC